MIIPILLLFNVNLSGFVMDNLSGIGSEVTMYLCKESFYVFEKKPMVDRTMDFNMYKLDITYWFFLFWTIWIDFIPS